ncbi:hypothetical protein PT974_01249 [Cladobotryum mycophilum]|uniref:Protein kinase domain-containing protein n=1 Tax=Cladobotryum mycophilum TaxID=491253 RepID=A0ABR0T486_9HYPO
MMLERIDLDKLTSSKRLTRYGSAYRWDADTVVKTGDNVFFAEAEMMRFITENTTIPIPALHHGYLDDDTNQYVLVMDYVEGETLDAVWEDYNEDEQEEVIAQLRDYMAQLRQFKGTFIGSIDGTCCNDPYFSDGLGGYGPFPAENEFNEGVVEAMRKDRPEAFVEYASDLWMSSMRGHESILTHNDFEPRNILVEGTEVVAILDWENAGYYPEYWEYCKAMRRPDWTNPFTASRAVDRILKPYPRELSVVWSCNEALY